MQDVQEKTVLPSTKERPKNIMDAFISGIVNRNQKKPAVKVLPTFVEANKPHHEEQNSLSVEKPSQLTSSVDILEKFKNETI